MTPRRLIASASYSTHSRPGFTIVEVLAAMTVIGVGLFGVFEALLITSDLSDQLRNEEAAQRVAERHITSILAKPVGEFGTQKGTEDRFNWEETTRASQHPNLMEVMVTVQWTQQGKDKNFQLFSLRHISPLGK